MATRPGRSQRDRFPSYTIRTLQTPIVAYILAIRVPAVDSHRIALHRIASHRNRTQRQRQSWVPCLHLAKNSTLIHTLFNIHDPGNWIRLIENGRPASSSALQFAIPVFTVCFFLSFFPLLSSLLIVIDSALQSAGPGATARPDRRRQGPLASYRPIPEWTLARPAVVPKPTVPSLTDVLPPAHRTAYEGACDELDGRPSLACTYRCWLHSRSARTRDHVPFIHTRALKA